MMLDSGLELKFLNVDGGVTNSDVCMQIQADLLGIPVGIIFILIISYKVRPANVEASALGAAIAAGLGAKVWNTLEEAIQSVNQVCDLNTKKFESNISDEGIL